ncbi:hypothetical protein HWV07_11410 [Natronomonas salina]|uniref:hypothetical protein n=1 Tax=Natronomonas salina TaxID=1710540 RepID=UPI0015B5B577|nr:hypothetical protein [Natronomonas salina]QLD89604.1 hypothetical protein HWV07_11410 [Natronomonas salina]
MQLYIDSGTHTNTDIEERIARIQSHLDLPDAVFTEESNEPPSLTKKLSHLLLAPLLVGMMIVWVDIVLGLLKPIFGDDRDIEDHLEQEHGAEKLPVDTPKLDTIAETPKLHFSANWAVIVISLLIWDVHGTAILTLVSLPFVSGVALMMTFLGSIHESRNSHIARRIANHASHFDEGCLVTGEDHHEPVAEILEDYPEVTVLNPSPESND